MAKTPAVAEPPYVLLQIGHIAFFKRQLPVNPRINAGSQLDAGSWIDAGGLDGLYE